VDKAIRAWLRADKDEGETEAGFDEGLARPDESLVLFGLCRMCDWAVLPEAGGWLDQPDWFVHDMALIARRMAYTRRREDKAKAAREKLARGKGRGLFKMR